LPEIAIIEGNGEWSLDRVREGSGDRATVVAAIPDEIELFVEAAVGCPVSAAAVSEAG